MANNKSNTQNVLHNENHTLIRLEYFEEHMKDLKYHILFCDCGHIHYIPKEDFDWMVKKPDKRRIVYFCQSCGAAYYICIDPYRSERYIDIEEEHGPVEYGGGELRVHGRGGLNARGTNGAGIGYTRWKDSERPCYTEEGWTEFDTKDFIKQTDLMYGADRIIYTGKLNMAEDLLMAISTYKTCINWKGTPYEGRDTWEF